MAILKFVPSPKKIRDNRNNDSGYYEAVCDVCGTHFFPKRSNAKYCTSKCAQDNHRSRLVGVKKDKRGPKKQTTSGVTLTGRTSVVGWFKKNNMATRGIGVLLKSLEVGKSSKWLDKSISRISPNRYQVD